MLLFATVGSRSPGLQFRCARELLILLFSRIAILSPVPSRRDCPRVIFMCRESGEFALSQTHPRVSHAAGGLKGGERRLRMNRGEKDNGQPPRIGRLTDERDTLQQCPLEHCFSIMWH